MNHRKLMFKIEDQVSNHFEFIRCSLQPEAEEKVEKLFFQVLNQVSEVSNLVWINIWEELWHRR